jgi:DNA polymerase-3 subunit alpha
LNEVDNVAKLIPNVPGKPVTIPEALEEVPDFKKMYETAPYLRDLIDTAAQMEGVVRNAGTHAAGVIITDKPLLEYIPLHRPTGSTANEDSPVKIVTQFEMSVLESLGLLKVDFLGLATLTIMARACDLISQRRGVDLNLDNIPLDDPATFELLGRGETAGVFQVEGSGMRRYLMQMKPKELANVIAMVALFRPGPMDFIPGYIRRMHGEEPVTYRHPTLEPIFKETYGFPVYQEQLMFAVMQLAGYSAPEADDLRKAVAKKVKEKLLKHRQKFIKGAVKNGVPESTAGEIFDDWEEFARYGFNKAHAADYGIIAVQTAYLKAHYPVEYMTAVLSVNLNDTAKVALYVADCRRMGIRIEPPDVSCSGWDFTIEDHPEDDTSTIRFGLGAVKNVGHGPVDAILKGRGDGEFTDLNDFALRVDLRQVGKRALESLIKVGALDRFGSRSALLEGIDRVISVSASHFRAAELGQMSLFGVHTGVAETIHLPQATSEISRRELLNWERELIGLYVSDHPLSPVMDELTQAVTHFSAQLAEVPANEKVRVAGMIVRIRHHQSKAGKPMGFVGIEDLQGTIELVIFPSVWAKFSALIEYDQIILVDGRLDSSGAEPKVLVDSLTTDFKMTMPLDRASQAKSKSVNPQFDKRQPATRNEASSQGGDVPVEEDYPASALSDVPDVGDEIPPMPEPPSDWDAYSMTPPSLATLAAEVFAGGGGAPLDEAAVASKPLEVVPVAEVAVVETEVSLEPLVTGESLEEDTPILERPISDVGRTNLTVEAAVNVPLDTVPETIPDRLIVLPPYLVPPVVTAGGDQVQMITVVLRASGDRTRDVLRLRRIHGMAMTYPGSDRFAVHVFEKGRGYLLEFPNFTTGVCPELVAKLQFLVGADNVRVEPITFH